MNKRDRRWQLVLGLAILAVPWVITNQYHIYVLNRSLLYAVLVLGLVILFGYTGQISLGQVAFYSIGAYTAALLSKVGVPIPAAIVLAALFSAVFGMLLSIPSFNLRGPFLSITTIGFGEIVFLIENNWTSVTGGSYGLTGIPPLRIGGWVANDKVWYYIGVALIAVTAYTAIRLRGSKIGRALVAIRDDDVAANVMGIDVKRYKLMAFSLSAFFGGIAGAFYAYLSTFISPDSFTRSESQTFLLMTVLGGVDKVLGGIASAIFLGCLPDILKPLQRYYLMIFALIVLVLVVYPPKVDLKCFGKRQSMARWDKHTA